VDVALIIGGIILVAVLAIVIATVMEKRRREGLRQVAGQLGLDFQETLAEPPGSGLARLHLFNVGHTRRAKNALSGRYGNADVVLFDYQYTTGHGKNRHTHRQTVAAFHLPKVRLPLFTLCPESVFHKIGSALGYQDIDFDRFPSFSSSYLLRGESEPAIRELFTDNRVMFFENRRGLSVEGGDDWLIVYRSRRRVRPQQVSAFLDETFEVRGVFAKR
jgi:hypothetical protein